MLPKDVPTFDFIADGKEYSVNFANITGSEARAFRQAVGTSLLAGLTEVSTGGVDPLELVAGFKWIIDRRKNPELEFEKVLDSLTYENIDLGATVEEEEEPDPTYGRDSLPPSPPSLVSTASGPGR